ncbi:MAG: GatB/YqeY domain-containing protein [Deltaproteobacteria bacterium]|nr:GatB/YqeY domain-containing protein [Deltaproteobacteria bacterium]
MSLLDDIERCFKTALKTQDRVQLSTLRLLKTALKNRAVQERRPLSEAEVVAVITSQVKQRRDSVVEFNRAGRSDLAQQEEEELRFLLSFLPQQLSGAELTRELESIIMALGAQGPGDLGKVMKAAMAKLAGRADGKEVNAIARKLLAGED